MTGLLPPNATPLERALDQVSAQLSDTEIPLLDLWRPMTCPIEQLPWLAWGLSIDRWSTLWTEAEKRTAVANAIADQRRKGTPASVDAVLASFDALAECVEWFEQSPRAAPYTFEVRLPLGAAGGTRATAAFAEAIIRDVIRVKPARAHFALVQTLRAAGSVGIVAAARGTRFDRHDATTTTDTAAIWGRYLQTETGEPLTAGDGAYLEDR